MYGIFTYIWVMFMVNVGKYTIHGSSGYGIQTSPIFRGREQVTRWREWLWIGLLIDFVLEAWRVATKTTYPYLYFDVFKFVFF